jgi:hypothetical protein
MDDQLYNSLTRYYKVLSELGYLSHGISESLLVLSFLSDILNATCNTYLIENEDTIYSGELSDSDKGYIVKALDCLYGSNCIILYPESYNHSVKVCECS